jgi:uncharacterized protein (TIGR00369 family)
MQRRAAPSLDELRTMRHGLLNYEVLEIGGGGSRLSWTPGENLSNPMGFVHGGFVATIVDDTCGTAVLSLLGEVQAFPTVNLNVDFVRGLRIGETFTCLGSVVRMGRRVTLADARIEDAGGQLLARGTCTFALDRPTPV